MYSVAARQIRGRILFVTAEENFFERLYARPFAQELARLGFSVEICMPGRALTGRFDVCILGDVVELLPGDDDDDVRRLVDTARRCSDIVLNFSAECVHLSRYQRGLAACREFGVDGVLDVGFSRQESEATLSSGIAYHFVFDGLTHEQAGSTPFEEEHLDRRIIPWTHIGMHSPERVTLTGRLVNHVSPDGLVYLPDRPPVGEARSRRLSPDHINRILARTEYLVWRSEHKSAHVESSRFRLSRQAGCLPLNVVQDDATLSDCHHFRNFVVRECEVVDRLKGSNFGEECRAFRAEYLQCPRLGDELERLLSDLGHSSGRLGVGTRMGSQVLERCA